MNQEKKQGRHNHVSMPGFTQHKGDESTAARSKQQPAQPQSVTFPASQRASKSASTGSPQSAGARGRLTTTEDQ